MAPQSPIRAPINNRLLTTTLFGSAIPNRYDCQPLLVWLCNPWKNKNTCKIISQILFQMFEIIILLKYFHDNSIITFFPNHFKTLFKTISKPSGYRFLRKIVLKLSFIKLFQSTFISKILYISLEIVYISKINILIY